MARNNRYSLPFPSSSSLLQRRGRAHDSGLALLESFLHALICRAASTQPKTEILRLQSTACRSRSCALGQTFWFASLVSKSRVETSVAPPSRFSLVGFTISSDTTASTCSIQPSCWPGTPTTTHLALQYCLLPGFALLTRRFFAGQRAFLPLSSTEPRSMRRSS